MIPALVVTALVVGGFCWMIRQPRNADGAETFALWFGATACAATIGLLAWIF